MLPSASRMVTAPTSRAWFVGVLAALGVVVAMPGCGENKPAGEGNPNGAAVIPGALSCGRDGDQTTCTVELGRKDGVVSCAKGTKTCTNRVWGPCVTGTSKTSRYSVPAPPPKQGDPGGATGTIKGLALASSPTDCADNPCDLYCQQYPDVP